MKLNLNEKILVQIERVCGDLRRGLPIFVTSHQAASKEQVGAHCQDSVNQVNPDERSQECNTTASLKDFNLASDTEGRILAVSPDNIQFLKKLLNNSPKEGKRLVISATRADYLFPGNNIKIPVSISADNLSIEEITSICSSSPSLTKLNYSDFISATKLEIAALTLAKISELMPAIITCKFEGDYSEDFLSISSEFIDLYKKTANYSLNEACQTELTLKYASKAEIIAYRPNIGGSEHYAIIIGTPGEEPLVRVHSSCYTGDLLASLSCDCRDQLQSAIELMGAANGGIILYLMQEGRGIGLVNKLRAYDLKNNGMDTVTANHALGFDDDERLFLPAAEILKKLGVSSVRLLTNNPRKSTGLEEHGIKVISCVPHIMESNKHNEGYLQTKANKMGHKL